MPIDETLIKSLQLKLSEEQSKGELKNLKIQRCLIAFQSIQQRKQRIQNETTGEIEEKILVNIDPGTGRPITAARKQDVYDATVAETRKVLGITSPTPEKIE